MGGQSKSESTGGLEVSDLLSTSIGFAELIVLQSDFQGEIVTEKSSKIGGWKPQRATNLRNSENRIFPLQIKGHH